MDDPLRRHSVYAFASASAFRCAFISHLLASVQIPFASLLARLHARLPLFHSAFIAHHGKWIRYLCFWAMDEDDEFDKLLFYVEEDLRKHS